MFRKLFALIAFPIAIAVPWTLPSARAQVLIATLSTHLMKLPLLRTTGPLVATIATLLFAPALTGAATVIDHVPYTITASGKYELNSDLTANGTAGIIVRAANVVINLNEFTLAYGQTGPEQSGVVVSAPNVTVRNGTISGFASGVELNDSLGKAEDLRLQGNSVGVDASGSEIAVTNCVIVGRGKTTFGCDGIFVPGNGNLIKNNQISKCYYAIVSPFGANACIQNYLANSTFGLQLTPHDYYQGNVATNCTTVASGGHAIGTENGGD